MQSEEEGKAKVQRRVWNIGEFVAGKAEISDGTVEEFEITIEHRRSSQTEESRKQCLEKQHVMMII